MSDLITMTKEHIKRPANHFMIWSCEKRQHYLIEKNKNKYNVKINNAEMSKMLGREWANLPNECKLKYKQKADELKKEHKLMYPDYKYEPKTKKQKYKKTPRIKKNSQQTIQEHQVKKSNIYEIEYTTQGTIKKYILYTNNIPTTSNISTSNKQSTNITFQKNKFIELNDNTYTYVNINTYANTYLDTDINTSMDETVTIMIDHILADKSNTNLLYDF